MTIVDKRPLGSSKAVTNRKKFIDRYKRNIKRSVDAIAQKRNIKDVVNDGEVTINQDELTEPSFQYDRDSGHKKYIVPGNKDYSTGDKVAKPQQGEGKQAGGGGDSGEGEDDFTFTLTKEEFLEIYFSDMELPNFVKKDLKEAIHWELRRAGYTREGIPSRISLKKTFEYALARRIVTKAQGKKPIYFDDIDIRYNHFIKHPKPAKKAAMFCVLDASASMTEEKKVIAKKFFMLLYLFLHKEYEKVDIIFIRHTHVATEVTEEEFFYAKESGGTKVSTALQLINSIIDDRYSSEEVNLYIAQASDGDNFAEDNNDTVTTIIESLLPKIQYFAYIEITDANRLDLFSHWGGISLYELYKKHLVGNVKFNQRYVHSAEDVYPVLRELFKKE